MSWLLQSSSGPCSAAAGTACRIAVRSRKLPPRNLFLRAGPVFASQTASTTLLAGVIFGYVLFGERLSPWVWGAIALMALGVLLVRPRNTGLAVQAAENRL